jgi:hypothetical protein
MRSKALAELSRLAEEFDLELLGRTARGHYRWRHRPSGQIIVTISNLKHHRAIDNTRRSIRRVIWETTYGHQSAD